ncbi:16S rRNA (adenine(1518)-N(6)/adenine(1519)-N(6))-dimethyltransferase RsmA [Patescibacteria group bacterium]
MREVKPSLKQRTLALCKREGLPPIHSYGQNFLINQEVLDDILSVASLTSQSVVIEIGSGIGVLTEKISEASQEVYAIELDRGYARYLKKTFKNRSHVHVINQDAIGWWETAHKDFQNGSFAVVSNLPFNIASHVLRIFLEKTPRPSYMVLLLQKEVAERVVAPPGEMSVLSVMVQAYSDVHLECIVSRESFLPQPQVDAGLVSIKNIGWKYPGIDEDRFFKIVKAGFSARRKKLKKNLSSIFSAKQLDIASILSSVGASRNSRAQELTLNQWADIVKAYSI